jgi:hypothetical protein
MMYSQIVPTSDWYFVHENVDAKSKPYTVYPVAVWALSEGSDVIGLIHAGGLPVENGQTPKLITPPPIQGNYLHLSELTSEQLRCLSKEAK